MYFVDVLQRLKERKLDIGFASDLKRRIKEHKTGDSASAGEKYFKATKGKRTLRLMLKDSLE